MYEEGMTPEQESLLIMNQNLVWSYMYHNGLVQTIWFSIIHSTLLNAVMIYDEKLPLEDLFWDMATERVRSALGGEIIE